MIRVSPFLVLGFVVAFALPACSTTSPRVATTPLHQGMTSAQLRAAYGDPISIQHRSNGAVDWFYNFGSPTNMTQLPIHLSPAGRVIPPLPAGSVLIE